MIKSEFVLTKLFNFYYKNTNKGILYFIRGYLVKFYEFFFYKKNVFSYSKFLLYIFILFSINIYSIVSYITFSEKKAMIKYLKKDIQIDSISYVNKYLSLYWNFSKEIDMEREARNEFDKNIISSRKYFTRLQESPEKMISPDYYVEINPEYVYDNIQTGETYSEQEYLKKLDSFCIEWNNNDIKSAYNENLKLKFFYSLNGIDKTYKEFCRNSNSYSKLATLNYNEGYSIYTSLDSQVSLFIVFLLASTFGSIIFEYSLINLSLFFLKKTNILSLLCYFTSIVFLKYILPLLIFNIHYSGFNFSNLFENLVSYNPLISQSIEPSFTSTVSFLFPLNNILIYLNFCDLNHIFVLLPSISIHLIIITICIFSIIITKFIPKEYYNKIVECLFILNSFKLERIILALGIFVLILEILQ